MYTLQAIVAAIMQMSTNHSARRYYVINDVTLFTLWKMDADSVNFVKLVKKYPVLWRTDHKLYGRRGPRDSALKNISKDFGNLGMAYYVRSAEFSSPRGH